MFFDSYLVEPTHRSSVNTQLGIGAFDDMYDDTALCNFNTVLNNMQSTNVVVNDYNMGSDQEESDLDVQYGSAISSGATILFNNEQSNYWILE